VPPEIVKVTVPPAAIEVALGVMTKVVLVLVVEPDTVIEAVAVFPSESSTATVAVPVSDEEAVKTPVELLIVPKFVSSL
jgi:hypothetical protein